MAGHSECQPDLLTRPPISDFADAFNKAKVVAHLGSHYDETGQLAHWHIPAAHYLESWSDARAYDGTVSIVQPMIDPLYGGKTAHDVFQTLLDEPLLSAYEAVRETRKANIKGDFETGWRKALHAGWIEDTAFDKRRRGRSQQHPTFPRRHPKDQFEIIFRPDPNIYDGRWSNVGWLQELPKPVTNLSWDNAAIVSGATLTKLKLEEDDIVEITVGGGKVKAPVIVAPGHPDNSVTVLSRLRARVRRPRGFGRGLQRLPDPPHLRRRSTPPARSRRWTASGASRSPRATTRIIAARTFSDVRQPEPLARSRRSSRPARHHPLRHARGVQGQSRTSPTKAKATTRPNRTPRCSPTGTYNGNTWGMSIDMNSCTGCNACIVGCYAENNIAVVGKQQVRIGRNMQWLRIDTYFEGDLAAPRAHFQPMTCQHCENAPCEQVCPVGATVHTPEGLNTMVYNRCVGTRYCSNNCPYKVRRFNFLLYSDYETESLKLMRNPDVSRSFARRDGEVQLLRAAHHRGQDRSRQGEPPDSRRRRS